MQTMSGGGNWRGTVATVLAAFCLIGFGVVEASLAAGQQPPDGSSAVKREGAWRGVHLMSPGRDGLPLLKRAISEKLAPMGVNALILEVNYGFAFRSHPELSGGDNALRVEDARDLAETCRKHNIRLVPMFNCLGHQSWAQQHPTAPGQAPRARRDSRGPQGQ